MIIMTIPSSYAGAEALLQIPSMSFAFSWTFLHTRNGVEFSASKPPPPPPRRPRADNSYPLLIHCHTQRFTHGRQKYFRNLLSCYHCVYRPVTRIIFLLLQPNIHYFFDIDFWTPSNVRRTPISEILQC